jgi:integrase
MPAATKLPKLTPLRLDAAKPADKAYKISDPAVAGLYCLVQPGGTKTFVLSYSLDGKRKEVTLGRYPTQLTLATARVKASEARAAVDKGEDPAALKQAAKAARKAQDEAPKHLFKTFAEKWQRDKLVGRSSTYKAQIASRLDRFVYPKIGGKPLQDITRFDVLEVIEPLQATKPVTAEGTRCIVQAVFAYAIQTMPGVEVNPASPLRGVVTVPKSKRARHLNPKEFAAFLAALNAVEHIHASTLAATRLLVYTMVRKSEVLRMRWTEYDKESGVWTIPAERMKKGIAHQVYLPQQAKDLLEKQRKVTGNLEYVFPSVFKNDQPLGAATLNHFFKRLDFGVPEFSPHGLRGTGATLCLNNGISTDTVRLLLAHQERGVDSHYHHHDLIPERTAALQWYADYIDSLLVVESSTTSNECLPASATVAA